MDEPPPPAEPLDERDPRFRGVTGAGPSAEREAQPGGIIPDAEREPDPGGIIPGAERELVRSQGPGPSPMSPHARILRVAFPLLFFAGVFAIVAVFMRALDEGPPQVRLGPEGRVRAEVAQRPKRICIREDASPCAWITVVNGELTAFDTNGPLPQEYGRLGVSWCPGSGRFGANATGSRWDAAGNAARGPAPRGLGRFDVVVAADGIATVDFSSYTVGLQAWQISEGDLVPAAGPDCEPIPFDRDADLLPLTGVVRTPCGSGGRPGGRTPA